jgi:hypothetical protein
MAYGMIFQNNNKELRHIRTDTVHKVIKKGSKICFILLTSSFPVFTLGKEIHSFQKNMKTIVNYFVNSLDGLKNYWF